MFKSKAEKLASRLHFNSNQNTTSLALSTTTAADATGSRNRNKNNLTANRHLNKQDFFNQKRHRIYSCIHCRAHLANHDELISKLFQGNHGRAYLFNKVVNVGQRQPVQRELLTGLHAVADIYCDNCETTLGWKYEQAFVPSQKYKEGKYIIELVHMLKENTWDPTSYNTRDLLQQAAFRRTDSVSIRPPNQLGLCGSSRALSICLGSSLSSSSSTSSSPALANNSASQSPISSVLVAGGSSRSDLELSGSALGRHLKASQRSPEHHGQVVNSADLEAAVGDSGAGALLC